jgi:hypothetical protein
LEYNILKNTFLEVPDVHFENKEVLKKKGVWINYRKPIIYTISAAASILLLIGLFFIFNPIDQNRIASTSYRIDITKMNQKSFSGFNHEFQYQKVNVVPSLTEQTIIALLPPEKEENTRVETPEALVALNINSLENMAGNSISSIEPKNFTENIIAFASEPEEKEGSFFGRFIAGLVGNALPDRDRDKKSLIEFTVDGYNFIADRDVEVEKQLDENGNVIAYNVKGDNINFTRKIKNNPSE